MFVCVLQNFALFASRLRKSSFISRQHLINNSKPITSLSSSSILWSLSSLTTTTTTTKQWGEVMRGTFTVFFFTFCDFWCDNDEKSPQASTSFQACVRIHLSPTVPDNTSFVETVWSDSFLINIYVPLYVFLSNVFFYIFGNEVFLFVLDDTELLRGYYPLCPLYPVQDETLNDVCITSVVSYRIRLYAHTEISLFVHIFFGVWGGGVWIWCGCRKPRVCACHLENASIK